MRGRIRGTGKPMNHNHFSSISKKEKKDCGIPVKVQPRRFFPQIRTVPMQARDDMATHEAKDMVTKHMKCVKQSTHKTTAQRTNGPKNKPICQVIKGSKERGKCAKVEWDDSEKSIGQKMQQPNQRSTRKPISTFPTKRRVKRRRIDRESSKSSYVRQTFLERNQKNNSRNKRALNRCVKVKVRIEKRIAKVKKRSVDKCLIVRYVQGTSASFLY